MGQTARELGFKGYFYEFLNPRVNIEFGCKFLAKRLEKSKGVVREALLKYNGGGDPKYPERVFRNLELLKKLNPRFDS